MNQELKTDNIKIKKKFLKRYQRIIKKIERLENKLADLDDQMTSPKIQKLTFVPRGGQPMTIADLVADKQETEERINNLNVVSKQIRKEILQVIDTLEDYHQVEVLELFFIKCLPLETISDLKGYTLRHTTRFYTEGIKRLNVEECQ